MLVAGSEDKSLVNVRDRVIDSSVVESRDVLVPKVEADEPVVDVGNCVMELVAIVRLVVIVYRKLVLSMVAVSVSAVRVIDKLVNVFIEVSASVIVDVLVLYPVVPLVIEDKLVVNRLVLPVIVDIVTGDELMGDEKSKLDEL